jgi:two-component system CheB/CheR fusion protein
VVDRQGYLALANEQARRLFGIVPTDLGRPIQDLEISYRPVELRSHIDAAYASRAPVVLRDVEWRPQGDNGNRFLELQVTALADGSGGIFGAAAAFIDQTVAHQLRLDLERAHQELETAFEEVQSANEELETTNEELQSTIEELETTNEELQSSNEELETMNEELQSTNDELRSLNEQVNQRSDELDLANGYLRSILASLRAAVVVLNIDLRIEIWSDKAQELWGLRSDEVLGQSFFDLDIGLPLQSLREPILDCMENGSHFHEVLAEGTNRRGRAIQCRISCTPLGTNGRRPAGVILLMEDTVQPTSSSSQ